MGISALIVLADQVSKYWVLTHLLPGESLPRQGLLRLTHIQNTGSAFGLFANQTFLLTVVTAVAVLALFIFLRYQPWRNLRTSLATGLLLGGSIGNLIDRIRLGHVTDFIDIGFLHGPRFYAFNVADAAITVGAITLALFLILSSRKSNPQE
jgi:signal peptidase II